VAKALLLSVAKEWLEKVVRVLAGKAAAVAAAEAGAAHRKALLLEPPPLVATRTSSRT
jgi:hypothetical protein